jgi:hypothetical protein
MAGRALGVATSTSIGESVQFAYIATSVSQTVYIAPQPMFLTQVSYRIRVGSSSGTVQVVKCLAGVAPASGTTITSALDISATPTADTTLNATLTPGNNGINLSLNTGDAIALVFGGTLTSGVGLVQLFFEPQA